ncbi:hypothetical protein HMN09_00468900 [Mycena chlorophos]|uniref:Uncharacterized protein n=1 Tax=Mycena chlorophos TaxID=658473 RepID=A0A8H6TIJ5_MYCCL|nr:hypothetical protein HMN09_00468900 [Mycena chlorophos]
MLSRAVFLLAALHLVAAYDQSPPDYETEVENYRSSVQSNQLSADGSVTGWKNDSLDASAGNFLSTSGITRMGWRLRKVAQPISSEIIYSLNASIGEPYNATIVQDPSPPPDAESISTGYYAAIHATWPSKVSREEEVEDKKKKREADHFDGPFTPTPWSQSFWTVFTDGCSSTLTTTVTDAAGTVTTWTNSLNVDSGQFQEYFPTGAVLPMTINMTSENPFRGSVVGTVGESPLQIALGEGSDAPSLYSYYQITAYFCGTQEDD